MARTLAALLFAPLFAACSDAGVIGLRLTVGEDFAGTITARVMQVPEAPAAIEESAAAVEWQERVDLRCTHGRYAKLSDLRIADVTFDAGKTGSGLSYLHVTFPRGAGARWPAAFAPSRDQRLAAERAFDPENKLSKPARTLSIVVQLPAPPIGHGVAPRLRGASSEVEGKLATLVLPIDWGLKNGPPIVWELTWR